MVKLVVVAAVVVAQNVTDVVRRATQEARAAHKRGAAVVSISRLKKTAETLGSSETSLSVNAKHHQKETEQIWRELSQRLRQFVGARVGSDADIDDILQTVFLRIHEKRDQLHKPDRLESWVFQITRNAVTDHFRKRKGLQKDEIETPVDDPHHDTSENLNSEIAGCLRTLIDRLPDDQRRAVKMVELEGVSQKQVAELESISISGAKSRIQRGRRSLEKMLKACCQFQLDRRGNVVGYDVNRDACCDGDCSSVDSSAVDS